MPRNCGAQKFVNETLLELAKLEFNLRLPAKRCQRKSSPDLAPARQDFVH